MEVPYCVQEKSGIQRTEKATEQDKNDKEIDIHKYSEPCMKSIKRSDVFEEPRIRKSHKKHCDWMKSSSDTYCPKFSKKYHMHQKTSGHLKKYVIDEPSISDLPQECETLSR